MNLKQAIITVLDRDSLKEICRYYGAVVDYRSKSSMAEYLLGHKSILAEELLECLTETQLKTVCKSCGLDNIGRKRKLIRNLLQMEKGPTFVAIDFETADYQRDSACAVGLVRVENHQIVERAYGLIRPPRKQFVFTYLHGITWDDVAKQPTFGELWPTFNFLLEDVEFLAAHNASFDQSVLKTCCVTAGLRPPPATFRCTVQMARQIWKIYPTKLNHVCSRLGIPLNHHQASSDAEACALIVIAAQRFLGKKGQ